MWAMLKGLAAKISSLLSGLTDRQQQRRRFANVGRMLILHRRCVA
jgi:hypothetical protein